MVLILTEMQQVLLVLLLVLTEMQQVLLVLILVLIKTEVQQLQ